MSLHHLLPRPENHYRHGHSAAPAVDTTLVGSGGGCRAGEGQTKRGLILAFMHKGTHSYCVNAFITGVMVPLIVLQFTVIPMYILHIQVLSHYQGGEKESFVEVMNQIFQPGHTTWTILAGVCERAGFTDLATALLDSYTTGEIAIYTYCSIEQTL